MAKPITTEARRAACFNNLKASYTCLLSKDYATDKEKEGAAALAKAADEQAQKYSSPASGEAQTV